MRDGYPLRAQFSLRPGFTAVVLTVLFFCGGAAYAQTRTPAPDSPDPRAVSIPERISAQIRRDPARGIALLADYLREPGNDELTVKRLHDWLSLYHFLDPNQTVPPGRSPHYLLTRGSGPSEGFARVFKELLDRAGIENVLVDGITRRYAGRRGEPLPWMWNAVRIGGIWRLVDTAMDARPSYRTSSERPESYYSGEYLFPDPEGLSLTHLPTDDRYLLTGRPLSRGEFLDRPLYSPSYARFDIEVMTGLGQPLSPSGHVWQPVPWEGIYLINDRYTGSAKLEFLIRKPDNIEVSAALTDRFGVRRPGQVLVYEDEEGAWVEISPSEPGDHTAVIFVRDDSGEAPWSRIYSFSAAASVPEGTPFPGSGRVYRHHGFFQEGLELTAAAVPAPSHDPAGCYLRITLPEGYEADGFFTNTETGAELFNAVASSYTGSNELEFRFFPPAAGRYRGGISLVRTRGRSRPERVLEFYLEVWEPDGTGIGAGTGLGETGPGGPGRPGYPNLAENLLLSRSFHREGLVLGTLTEYDPDTGYTSLSVRVSGSFYEKGMFLDCDAVDERGEKSDFHAAYHRSSEGYRFFFTPAADRDLTGRIILRRRDPGTGSFRSEEVTGRLTLPRVSAETAPLPPADLLAHQNGAYLGGTGIVRENITNRFVEGFIELTLSHPTDAELYVWYRDAAGSDFSRDSIAVSIPAPGERSFRFRHPRFDPAVARIMVRSGSTGGEFLPAYEFTVLPGLRTAESLPPAGTLHFYPAFSRNGLVLENEELRVPADGRYRVEVRTPERYGLVAEVVDGSGRKVNGAVHLRIREDVYAFSFDPPPAGREYTVTLYLTDRFGSRIPVALFKLS